MSITDIRYSPGSWREQAAGLLGYVQFTVVGLLRVDGVTVRRSREGRVYLAYPSKRGEHPYLRPVDDVARRAIEEDVLRGIDLKEAS